MGDKRVGFWSGREKVQAGCKEGRK